VAKVADSALSIIAETSSRPAVSIACRALLWRLATHPHQLHDGQVYVELSIGYLQRLAEVSYGSANSAWHITSSRLPWHPIHRNKIERLGFMPRQIRKGGKWGQHLLFEEGVHQQLQEFAEWMIVNGLWYPPSPDISEVDWTPLRVVRGRNRLVAHCPWHEDNTPSMLININQDDPRTGYGVCMACHVGAKRLSAFIRLSHDGVSWEARLSRAAKSAAENLQPVNSYSPIDGIHNQGALGKVGSPGRVVLGRLSPAGLVGDYAKGGLLETLKWADRCGEAAERRAYSASAYYATGWHDNTPTTFLPDRLVSVSEMRASSWRSFQRGQREVFVPSRFKATRQRWVLMDLDNLDRTPIMYGKRKFISWVAAVAERDNKLSGKFASVRTSPNGIQIWYELANPKDPEPFFRSWRTRKWLNDLGKGSLDYLGEMGCTGGIVDQSAFAGGRFGRRPGWRLLDWGEPYRVSLIGSSTP